MTSKRIVVLISGSGSNLQALIDSQNDVDFNGHIVGVVSNIETAYGLQRAQLVGIPTSTISHKNYSSRLEFDKAMANIVDSYQPDLIILAGFMRILTPWFVNQYQGKTLNIHPSLLPKYPGLHTHKRALENKDEFHGSSVHFVTEELDGGPVIAQSKTEIRVDDNQDSLVERVLKLEHKLYPFVTKLFINDKIKLEDKHVLFENRILEKIIEV